jgi:hypothetical protein
MSNHDDDRSSDDGVYQSESAAPQHLSRRRRIAIGAVGLTAVVSAGAYLIIAQTGDEAGMRRDVGALAPAASASVAESISASAAASPGPAAGSQPAAAATPSKSMSVDERIKAAREAAAKDGHPVQRARTPSPGAVIAAGEEPKQRTEKLANGVLRIVTAKYDLTGQRELLWPAGKTERVGSAECTQTFQFSNEGKPSTKKNLLLCWRTSAQKSVVTVLVDQDGKPSAAKSVETIAEEWAKLG